MSATVTLEGTDYTRDRNGALILNIANWPKFFLLATNNGTIPTHHSLAEWLAQFTIVSTVSGMRISQGGGDAERDIGGASVPETAGWRKRPRDGGAGVDGTWTGNKVIKPDGKFSTLFTSTYDASVKRFDMVRISVGGGRQETFRVFSDKDYKSFRAGLEKVTDRWKKNLAAGSHFNENAWSEPGVDAEPRTLDRTTARSRRAAAAKAVAAKMPKRMDMSEEDIAAFKLIDTQNVLFMNMVSIAERSGITKGKTKLKNASSYTGRPEGLMSRTASPTDVGAFIHATTDQLGSLAPLIRFFYSTRTGAGKERDEEVFFSDHIHGKKVVELAKARSNNDASVLSDRSTDGTNAGIKSFEWVYENRHFGENILTAKVALYFSSVADLANSKYHQFLFLTGDRPRRAVAGFGEVPAADEDLIDIIKAEEQVARRKFNMKKLNEAAWSKKTPAPKSSKSYRELKAVVGWSVPQRKTGRMTKDFIDSVRKTQKTIKLNLIKFDVNFMQEGQVMLNMQFAGSIGNFLADEGKTDVLGMSVVEENLRTTPIDVPVAIGDLYLGDGRRLLPRGYIARTTRFKIGKNLSRKFNTDFNRGILGRIGTYTVPLTIAGVEYEIETLRLEHDIWLAKLGTADTAKKKKEIPAIIARIRKRLKSAQLVRESMDNLLQKVKYSSFLTRIMANKKIYYSTIRKTAIGSEFDQTGKKQSSAAPKTAAKVRSASDSAKKNKGGFELHGTAFVDPVAAFSASDMQVENAGEITAYFIRLGDILDAALLAARDRKDIGMIIGSFDPREFGILTPQTSLSLADIPISIETFGEWFRENIVSPGIAKISFRRFTTLLINELVTPLINNMYGPGTNVKMSFDVSILQTSANFVGGGVYNEDDIGTKMAMASSGPNVKTNQYFIITCDQISTRLRGRQSEDEKRGIYHLVLGADRGLVKSFSFSEKRVPYLRAMNLANANLEGALVIPQDAELTMVGNNLFQNGQMVYINADLGFGSVVAQKLGLGGYYRVYKSENFIESGKYETKISCMWERGPK